MPLAVTAEIEFADLTAPSARLAIALIALADKSGRLDVMKTVLERIVRVRLDNASRLLEPVMHRFLADVAYARGERGRTAGVITGQFSGELMYGLVGQSGGRVVEIAADELRAYRSVGALTFRVRLAAAFANPSTRTARWRVTAENAQELFGPGVTSVASLKRDNSAREPVSSISLAKAGHIVVMPALKDLDQHAETFRVTASVLLDGDESMKRRRWIAIDVQAHRYQKTSLADLARRAEQKARIG